ncbi:MAG: hypothetical protein IPL65_19080 [Lewinellaceae bacterium]|nr:hypothetical protein [Lewinellaceae bacterium]
MEHPHATLTTNGFSENPIATILIATVAGLTLMMASIMVGMPMLISMAALFGGIFLVYGYGSGHMEYQMTDSGIYRNFTPFGMRYGIGKEQEQFVPWSEIKSYRLEKDFSRQLKEVETLRIYCQKPPFTLWITDQKDKAAFRIFADTFVAYASGQPVPASPSLPMPQAFTPMVSAAADAPITRETRSPHPIQQKGIVRKPGFYKTIWAKLLTMFFAVFSLVMLLLLFSGSLSWTSAFRLLVFILPGTAYMVWRSFLKQENIP